jgi:penicillin-binding protein 1A
LTIRADIDFEQARRRRRWAAIWLGIGLSVALAVALTAFWLWRLVFADLPATPDKAGLTALNRPPSIVFLDRNGLQIGRRGLAADLRLDQLPPYAPRAFLAAEDRRFYSHRGVDLRSVGRAVRADLKAKRIVEGGSTITQQIARTLFLNQSQTLKRKLQEAVLALRIEQRMSKDEILALYLNRIYFGAGAYGIEAASRTYFAKPAQRLTLSESALLAALPKAPSRLDPTNDLEAAVARSKLVLSRMREAGWITAAEQQAALADPPRLAKLTEDDSDFGHVLDLAAARAKALIPSGAPDVVVTLTIDSKLQKLAAAAVRGAVSQGRRQGATEAAMASLAPGGAIRALVGGVDHRRSGFDRAVQARRQPGSAFKPFVYAAALEAGLHPDTIRTDAPVSIGGWRPQNAGLGYAGDVTLAQGLARSINTISARLTNEVGADKVAALARRFGIERLPASPGASIALGAYEVTLLDLVSAYQVFQQGGRRSEPYLIEAIHSRSGQELYRRPGLAPVSVYDAALNGQMVAMMQGVIEEGTGRAARLDRPAAGKTGTSQDYRDAWFVGFTPELATAVWVGDDQARPMRRIGGGDLPARVWQGFMTIALEGQPVRPFDDAGATVTEEDPRNAFYAGLAADLARLERADNLSPPAAAEPQSTIEFEVVQ